MSDEDFTPDEPFMVEDEDGGDFDFRVNMTEEEASSEGRDLTPLPSGKYLVAVTGVKVKTVTNPPKPGKPDNRGKYYFAMELTIQDGDYAGRKAWTNVMLFDGALYTAVQMLKALGVHFNGTNFQVEGYEKNVIPKGDWWMGKEMVTYVKLKKGGLKEDGTRYDDRGEPVSFFPVDGWTTPASSGAGASSGSSSLLPD